MNRDYAYCVGPNYFGGPALCQNCKRHIPFSQPVNETLTWTMPMYDEKTGKCPLYEPKSQDEKAYQQNDTRIHDFFLTEEWRHSFAVIDRRERNGKPMILDLILKGKWYDMIANGEKREEYREIKPYWIKRIMKCIRWCSKGLIQSASCKLGCYCYDNLVTGKRLCYSQQNGGVCGNLSDFTEISSGYSYVRFRRGYTCAAMLFKCEGITIGKGNPEWGAPEGEVFIIKLGERVC